MSLYEHQNDEDFNYDINIVKPLVPNKFLCIACSVKDVSFIKLSACSHLEYLKLFTEPKMRLEDHMVCYQCHAMLKKIKLFKIQVENNLKQLLNQTIPISNHRGNIFEVHKAIDIHIPGTENKKENHLSSQELPKSMINDKRQKTIETALKIINKKDESMNFLASTLNILATHNLSQITAAILGETSKEVTKTVLPVQENTEKVLPIQNRVEVKGIAKNNNTNLPVPSSNILLVQLSKEELEEERWHLAHSSQYLKALHRCDSCLLPFSYRENLQHHVDTKHTLKAGSISCEVCSQYVHPPEELAAHMARHVTRYQCSACRHRFGVLHEAERHYARVHVTRKIKCKLCGFTTPYKLKFRAHLMKLHSRYPCARCRTLHKSLYDLQVHRRLHHGIITSKPTDK